MKKLILCLIVLLFTTTMCFAQFGDNTYVKGINIKTYISNNVNNAEYTNNVSTSTFLLSYRILGFEVVAQAPTGSTPGQYGILYDSTSTVSDSSLIGEVIPPVIGFDGIWYPYPKSISTGLTIVQGAYTKVIVYYVTE